MSGKQQERRKYFRIIDEIAVSFQVISEESDTVEEKKAEAAVAYFHKTNTELQSALELLEKDKPQIANTINLMNRKLDKVITLMELENLLSHHPVHYVQQASISACGIAFPVDEAISQGSLLELTLHLQSSVQKLTFMGRVLDCQTVNAEDQHHYFLRLDFVEVDEQVREKLIQYIVQRQSLQLTQKREKAARQEAPE